MASVTFCVSFPKHSFQFKVVIIALLQPQNEITDWLWQLALKNLIRGWRLWMRGLRLLDRCPLMSWQP